MSDVAIHVEKLGKRYQIGAKRERYYTLRDSIVEAARAPIRRLVGGNRAQSNNHLWALKDVSFEVRQGEVLGIIGRNGAGKSTLLKILSRITEPTEGYADVYGRVGSLLEVGTGFHPELTGRENIYLSGAVLGMRKREIDRKFDEIVAFAEVDKFIDTPVKRFSSGMYMRLAFSVAAHLEPEILLVDEVLAVGDSRFQEKCLGKMNDVARRGRTVLFVSHNMAAVQQLCGSGLVLEAGNVVFSGPIEQAIANYTEETSRTTRETSLRDRLDRKGDGTLRFTSVRIYGERNTPVARVLSGDSVTIRFYYESQMVSPEATVNIAFNVYNAQGVRLANLNSKDVGRSLMPVYRMGFFECMWPRFNLRSGVYTCALFCEVNGSIVDWLQRAFQIHVEDGDFFGTGSLVSREQGDVLVDCGWNSHSMDRQLAGIP